MNRQAKRLGGSIAAAAAVTYLAVMVVTGALPENRQVVKFEAAGVLHQAPESIVRIAMKSRHGTYVFVRRDLGWSTESGNDALDTDAAKALDRALTIMHNSKPVRVLTREEIGEAGPGEFGLDRPQLTVTMEDADGAALTVHFGRSNTDGILQYMAVNGSDQLYLMSDFVGQGWEQVAATRKRS